MKIKTKKEKCYYMKVSKTQKIMILLFCQTLDEIPDLNKLRKFDAAYSHKMFMYKLNLQNLNENIWIKNNQKKYLNANG